jgi:hypothetical protein
MATTSERLWTLAATALVGLLAFVPSYYSTNAQIAAARATEFRNTQLAALLVYTDACTATVDDDRVEGILIFERIDVLNAGKKGPQRLIDSIDTRYDHHQDEAEVRWSTMIAKRDFANLVFNASLLRWTCLRMTRRLTGTTWRLSR